jgi:hypothetical protein
MYAYYWCDLRYLFGTTVCNYRHPRLTEAIFVGLASLAHLDSVSCRTGYNGLWAILGQKHTVVTQEGVPEDLYGYPVT